MLRKLSAFLCAAACLLAGAASAATFTPPAGVALNYSMKNAKCGDDIQLAPGAPYIFTSAYSTAYDKVCEPGQEVLIVGPREASVNGLAVQSAGGYVLRGFTLNTVAGKSGLSLQTARNITLDNVACQQLAPGATPDQIRPITGTCVHVLGSKGVKILNSEFARVGVGIAVRQSDGVEISGNTFRDMSTDGMQIGQGGVSNITVSNNLCTDFWVGLQADGNQRHADCIQTVTAGATAPLVNVQIVGNRAVRGQGDDFASLQMGDEADRNASGYWTQIKVGYTGLKVMGNMFASGGHCINIEGAVEPVVGFNVCAQKSGETWGDIQIVHGIGGHLIANFAPGGAQVYRPIRGLTTAADVQDAGLVAPDYVRAEAIWGAMTKARLFAPAAN